MAEARHEVEIETVAEVRAIERETINVMFHPDDRIVQILANQRYGDVASITFPLTAANAIITAIQRIVDAEQGEAPYVIFTPIGGVEQKLYGRAGSQTNDQ